MSDKIDDGTVTIDIKRYLKLLEVEENFKKVLSQEATHTLWYHRTDGWREPTEVKLFTNNEAVEQLSLSLKNAHTVYQRNLSDLKESANQGEDRLLSKIDDLEDYVTELKEALKVHSSRIFRWSPFWEVLQQVSTLRCDTYIFNKNKLLLDKEEVEKMKTITNNMLKHTEDA